MDINEITTEQEALEQLRHDSQKSTYQTLQLLEWLDKKEVEWVSEFERLSKEVQTTDMNHYRINYLIGLSLLIPVIDTFRTELKRTQSVFCEVPTKDVLSDYSDRNDWGSNENEIDDWLKDDWKKY